MRTYSPIPTASPMVSPPFESMNVPVLMKISSPAEMYCAKLNRMFASAQKFFPQFRKSLFAIKRRNGMAKFVARE